MLRAIARPLRNRSGVRGTYTADVLWNIGIKNVRIIGCPTLFRHRDADLRIDLPPLEKVRTVGYTLRREVVGDLCAGHQPLPDRSARTLILELADRRELTVFAQGEIEEKKVVLGTPEQREEAIAKLSESGWFTGKDDPMEKLYRKRLFYSDVVAEYDAAVRASTSCWATACTAT